MIRWSEAGPQALRSWALILDNCVPCAVGDAIFFCGGGPRLRTVARRHGPHHRVRAGPPRGPALGAWRPRPPTGRGTSSGTVGGLRSADYPLWVPRCSSTGTQSGGPPRLRPLRVGTASGWPRMALGWGVPPVARRSGPRAPPPGPAGPPPSHPARLGAAPATGPGRHVAAVRPLRIGGARAGPAGPASIQTSAPGVPLGAPGASLGARLP